MRRILVNPHRRNVETRKYSQVIDSGIPYTIDWSLAASDRGVSVSSVAWSSEGSQNLAVTDEALASGVATCTVTAVNPGFGVLKCTATYSDGNTENQYINIEIQDPER